jgi:uncharacterized protein YcfJ
MSFDTTGALGGAASGAALGGSFGGGIGAGIGAIGGALFGGFMGGGKPQNQETESQRRLAMVSREQWDRYKSNYYPLEQMLADYVNDPNGRQNAMQGASSLAEGSFEGAKKTWEQQAEGLGLDITPDQERSYDRHLNLEEGKARVGAANNAGVQFDAIRRVIQGI